LGNIPKRIIVLEGLPASGKTTLANYLVQKYQFSKINESLGRLSEKNITDDQEEIFLETLEKYQKAARSIKTCMIDRGVPSMICWDFCAEKLGYAKNYQEKVTWVEEAIQKGELYEPDLYVYIGIDPEDSLKRRERPQTDIDVWSGYKGMAYAKLFYDDYFSSKSNVVNIDGTLDIEQAAKIILERLYEKN